MKRKYPSTGHIPFSPEKHRDDSYHPDFTFFEGKEVVILEKMDGENLTVYSEKDIEEGKNYHARSLQTPYHSSRTYAAKFANRVGHVVPSGWRMCGENVYATHSIKYTDLRDYIQIFSVWNDQNKALSWDETKEFCEMLEEETFLPVTLVPEIWRGEFDREFIKSEFTHEKLCEIQGREVEGYVMRTVEGFHYDDFENHLAKYVRPNHVQTSEHWLEQWDREREVNELRDDAWRN